MGILGIAILLFSGCESNQEREKKIAAPVYTVSPPIGTLLPIDVGHQAELTLGIKREELVRMRSEVVSWATFDGYGWEMMRRPPLKAMLWPDDAEYYFHNGTLAIVRLGSDAFTAEEGPTILKTVIKKFVDRYGAPLQVRYRENEEGSRSFSFEGNLITGLTWESQGVLITLWYMSPYLWKDYDAKYTRISGGKTKMHDYKVDVSIAPADITFMLRWDKSPKDLPSELIAETNSFINGE